jgi:phosphohistidine phosphatase
MKRILLLRHAKSSWENSALTDFDRPLNERGKTDATKMATVIGAIFTPEFIWCSPAKRTIETAYLYCVKLGLNKNIIRFDDGMYEASVDNLINVIRGTSPSISNLMIIAHNPSITELVSKITEASIDNIPTCGAVLIDTQISDWHQLNKKTGFVDWFGYPKQFS